MIANYVEHDSYLIYGERCSVVWLHLTGSLEQSLNWKLEQKSDMPKDRATMISGVDRTLLPRCFKID